MDKVLYNMGLSMIEDALLDLGGQRLITYGLPDPKKSRGSIVNRDYLMETSYDIQSLAQNLR